MTQRLTRQRAGCEERCETRIDNFTVDCFYRDIVKTINDMECGLIIGNNRYNVICYADDLLLTSATSTGLQTLVNSCQKYVEEHGLCFNPAKTSCTVIGKSPFTTEATFYISVVKLQNANTWGRSSAIYRTPRM